jgi:hypothetical protein
MELQVHVYCFHVRWITRACKAALFPVCASPSSFRIFFRSLLMSVRERSVMVAAMCCRLAADMVGVVGWMQ